MFIRGGLLFFCTTVFGFVLITSTNAQSLPGGATPGGALPDVSEQRRPFSSPDTMIVKPLIDRLEEDDDAGPRIPIYKFHVYANRRSQTAWRGGEYLKDVDQFLQKAVTRQPAGGFTLVEVQELAKVIETNLREEGMPLAQVFIPVQMVRNNEMWLEVMEGRIGDIVTEGNERYKDRLLKKPVEDLEGAAVDNQQIEKAILTLRDYPGIAVSGLYSPGDELGTTNLVLNVNDEDPWEFGVTADNHGSQFTGEHRLLASANVNNLLGLADKISLSALQTYSPENGTYGAISYSSPIFSPFTLLSFSYINNVFEVGSGNTNINAANIEGDTQIAQVGLTHNALRSRDKNLALSVNLKSKRATVEDVSTGMAQAEDKLSVLDFGLFYDSVDSRFRGLNNAYVGVSFGLPDFLGSLPESEPGETLGSSRANRAGTSAGGEFVKWYGQFTRLQTLTENTELLIRTSAQFSDDLLVSLEQFSLGGPNSVRAYPPAEFLVDTGGFASLEWIIAAPGFADAEAFSDFNWGEVLRFSLFFDYAGGYLSDPAFGEEKTRDLSGYGLGIDFRLPGIFWARLDVAKPNSDFDASDGDDPQVYLSFNFSF